MSMFKKLKLRHEWAFGPVYNCNCPALNKGEKFHRTNCASQLNAPPNKHPVMAPTKPSVVKGKQ